MDPIDTADAAFGWALIAAAALACYFGVPALIRWLVVHLREDREAHRLEREQIEDDLDDLARMELLADVERADRIDQSSG